MIKNLIPTLPEHGKIKAGTKGEEAISSQGKKFRLPQKLDHYIITTTERDAEGKLVVDTDLMDVLKKSKDALKDKDGNLVGIPIRLLYNSIDLNFATRYACFVGGKCVCSGDNETAITRDGRTVNCPCEKIDPFYKGKDKCRANGRLTCVIEGTPMVGSCHVLRTTSINTVKSILGSLLFYHTAAKGLLSFLPFMLVLKPMTVTIPTTGQLTTVYISSVLYRGTLFDLKREALAMAKENAQLMIEMNTIEETARELMLGVDESEEEQKEINEEFYPDTMDVTSEIAEEKPEEKVLPIEKEPVKPSVTTKPKKEKQVKKTLPAEKKKKEKKLSVDESDPPVINPITDAQKRKIIELKKAAGITDKKIWKNLVAEAVPSVTTAVDMTAEEADKFIEMLRKKYDDIPF